MKMFACFGNFVSNNINVMFGFYFFFKLLKEPGLSKHRCFLKALKARLFEIDKRAKATVVVSAALTFAIILC